jgi:hypothetical protein
MTHSTPNVVFLMVSKLLLGDAEVVVQFRTMTETSGLNGTKESEMGFQCFSGCVIEVHAHRNSVYRPGF